MVETVTSAAKAAPFENRSERAGSVTAPFVMADGAMELAQPDEDLLEVAIREHARLIYRIAYSVVRNASEAEDAVQEVFLRALRYGKRFAGVSDQKAWLAQIAWRVAVENGRQGTREAARNEQTPENDSFPSRERGAEQVLLEKERSEFLMQLISALPDELRDPLVLSALEELSPREIGTILRISEAAVRSRAFRARQILRDRMAAWARMGVKK